MPSSEVIHGLQKTADGNKDDQKLSTRRIYLNDCLWVALSSPQACCFFHLSFFHLFSCCCVCQYLNLALLAGELYTYTHTLTHAHTHIYRPFDRIAMKALKVRAKKCVLRAIINVTIQNAILGKKNNTPDQTPVVSPLQFLPSYEGKKEF